MYQISLGSKFPLPDWPNTSSVTVPDNLSSKGHRSRFEITDWLISIPSFYTLETNNKNSSLPEITKDTQNQAVLTTAHQGFSKIIY